MKNINDILYQLKVQILKMKPEKAKKEQRFILPYKSSNRVTII